MINKFKKRAPKEYLLNVDWYKKDEKTGKYISMDINQDLVVNTDNFDDDWKLSI